MPHGTPWNRDEIAALVRTATEGGCPLALSAKLKRTPDAVSAKAARLQLPLTRLRAIA